MKATLEGKTKIQEEAKLGLGLCTTCSNLGECTFPRSSNSPIMHCDEFSGYEMRGLVLTVQDLIPAKKTKTTVATKPLSTKLKGLCMNCDNNEDCTYPKSESGVWHCDEYR
jgi:hypothetical protein